MRCVKVDLPREQKRIEILLLADWHIGSRKVRYAEMQRRINYIKENDNVYAICVGDLINNATIDSVSDSYEEELTPQQQQNAMVGYLEPIKDKILGVVSGNHCDRTKKKSGIDITYNAMAMLGIQDRYDPVGCLLFIRVGEVSRGVKESNGSGKVRQVCYTLYMSHGASGGSTVGGKANALSKKGKIVNADIIVGAHTHQSIIFPEQRLEVDTRNNTVTNKVVLYINSDSLLDYEAYAERHGMAPSASVNAIITLNGERKQMECSLKTGKL